MPDGSPEDKIRDLQARLLESIERVEDLRRDAAEVAADLRNRLHAVTLQRRALERRRDGRRPDDDRRVA